MQTQNRKDERTQKLYAQFLDFKPRKGDLRRIAVLEAAIDLIHEGQVQNLSFEALGKRAGMTRAHVAYYFESCEQIVEHAIKFCVATAQSFTVETVREAKSDDQQLDGFIKGTFRWAQTYPKQPAAILLMWYYAATRPEYRKMHSEVRQLGAERIALALEPHLPKNKQNLADEMAKLIQSILSGHLTDWTTTRTKETLVQLEARTRAQVKKLIECVSR